MTENTVMELVPVSHPEVFRALGVESFDDPAQAVRRMVRENGLPHVRIGRRIRLSLPVIKQWVAEKMENSVATRAEEAA